MTEPTRPTAEQVRALKEKAEAAVSAIWAENEAALVGETNKRVLLLARLRVRAVKAMTRLCTPLTILALCADWERLDTELGHTQADADQLGYEMEVAQCENERLRRVEMEAKTMLGLIDAAYNRDERDPLAEGDYHLFGPQGTTQSEAEAAFWEDQAQQYEAAVGALRAALAGETGQEGKP